jgi:hypothetical protein
MRSRKRNLASSTYASRSLRNVFVLNESIVKLFQIIDFRIYLFICIFNAVISPCYVYYSRVQSLFGEKKYSNSLVQYEEMI